MKCNLFWLLARVNAIFVLSDSVASLLFGIFAYQPEFSRTRQYGRTGHSVLSFSIQMAHQVPPIVRRREYLFERDTTGKLREGQVSFNSSRTPVKASYSFGNKRHNFDDATVRTGRPLQQQSPLPIPNYRPRELECHNQNYNSALSTEKQLSKTTKYLDSPTADGRTGKVSPNRAGPARSSLQVRSPLSKAVYRTRREDTAHLSKLNEQRKNRRNTAGWNSSKKAKTESSSPILILPVNGTIDTLELACILNISYKKLRSYFIEDFGTYLDESHRTVGTELAATAMSKLGIRYCMENLASHSIVRGLRVNNASSIRVDGSQGRQPVVAVLGHVDVGKTTLLSYIRKNLIKGYENGGITQSLSAFNVSVGTGSSNNDTDGQFITFIDTPGHSAFGDMRLRSIRAADIVVIVIAADDGVMEQTKECIAACRRQDCPFIIAINKIDRVNIERVDEIEQNLLELDVVLERFGGEIQCTKINAQSGAGVQTLVELISLQALIMELSDHHDGEPRGFVLESTIDKHLGVVATVLMRHGVLRVGDAVLTGSASGRVKRLLHTTSNIMSKEIGPSAAAKIIGFSVLPEPGSEFTVCRDWKLVKAIGGARKLLQKDEILTSRSLENSKSVLEFVSGRGDDRTTNRIPLVLKCDSVGSLEVVRKCIFALNRTDSSNVCKFDIVHSGVGTVTSSDLDIADAVKGHVVAFNVPDESQKTSIAVVRHYSVIYDLLDSLSDLLGEESGRKSSEMILGKAVILKVFSSSRMGTIVGCRVIEGILITSSPISIKRQNEQTVSSALIETLQTKRDKVDSVGLGAECGIKIVASGEHQLDDVVEGDIIECYPGT